MSYARHNRIFARQAFTLIELLVVVAIIALLVGLLLSVVHSAREAAKRVQCFSNMRQIFVAIRTYADDNDGYHRGLRNNWIQWFSSGGHAQYQNEDVFLLRHDDENAYWGILYTQYLDGPGFPSSAYDPSVGIAGEFTAPGVWEIFTDPAADWMIPQDNGQGWESASLSGSADPPFDDFLKWSTYCFNAYDRVNSPEESARLPGSTFRLMSIDEAIGRSIRRPINGVLAPFNAAPKGNRFVGRRFSDFRRPSELILFQDGAEVTLDGNGDTLNDLDQQIWRDHYGDAWVERAYYRHGEGCSVAWADGHVDIVHEKFDDVNLDWYTGGSFGGATSGSDDRSRGGGSDPTDPDRERSR